MVQWKLLKIYKIKWIYDMEWEMVRPINRIWVTRKMTIAFKTALLGLQKIGIGH